MTFYINLNTIAYWNNDQIEQLTLSCAVAALFMGKRYSDFFFIQKIDLTDDVVA